MSGDWQLRMAARCVRAGGVIAYPTEAVYGLGCDPLDGDAVFRLLDIKRRPLAQGLILIGADFSQLAPYVGPVPASVMRRVRDTWPGPVTWLLPAAPALPYWLRGAHVTIAVRVTAHPLAAALCRAVGHALVSTSANRHGRPAARTALQVERHLGGELDYVLNGRVGPRRRPSEIRDALSGRVVRPG
ncbi:MAG: L-threonylcarbamoyladenylate synthase [Gammaproteobacteria bacterium]|nr:L-threonylcarbamoyladenylate synthase [Gammaproteobacteria bacterium]